MTSTNLESNESEYNFLGWESLAKDLRQPDEGNDYVFFPEDDVTVEVIHKTFRTVEDPTLTDHDHCEGFVKSNFHQLVKAGAIITHHNRSFTSCEPLSSHALEPLTYGDFAQELVSSPNGEGSVDACVPELFDESTVATLDRAVSLSRHNRLPALSLMSPKYEWKPALANVPDRSSLPITLTKPPLFRFTVEMKNLKLATIDVEPLFATCCLIDVKNHKKLTEDFHCDVNSLDSLSLLEDRHKSSSDDATNATSFTFALPSTDVSENTVLLIKVAKVFSGEDIEKVADEYHKVPSAKLPSAAAAKLHESAKGACASFGSLRQPFVFAALNIFWDNGTLKEGNLGETEVFRCQAGMTLQQMMEIAGEARDPKKRKGMKQMMAQVDVLLKRLGEGDIPPRTVDSSLRPLKSLLAATADEPLYREVTTFPQPSIYPHETLENTLYIYPESVNLKSLKSKFKLDNITCRVYFLANDQQFFESDFSPCFYGGAQQDSLIPCYSTLITPHERAPVFADEIKLQLPHRLTSAHHLLFQFESMNTAPPKGKKDEEPPTSILGYAFLPLFVNGIIPMHPEPLTVYSVLEAGYLSGTVSSKLAPVDPKKPQLFSLNLKLNSSLYAHNPVLAAFFMYFDKVATRKGDLENALLNMLSLDIYEITPFLPAVLSCLFSILVVDSTGGFAKKAFEVLIYIFGQIKVASPEGMQWIRWYIHHDFGGKTLKHSTLSDQLTYHLAERYEGEVSSDEIGLVWIFFESIVRSHTVHMHHEKLLTSGDRSSTFSLQFSDSLSKLMKNVAATVVSIEMEQLKTAKALNSSTAAFLVDLLSIGNRGIVLDAISVYLDALCARNEHSTEAHWLHFLDALQIILDYEHLVPLIAPHTIDFEPTLEGTRQAFREHFPFLAYLVDCVFDLLGNKVKEIRIRGFLLIFHLACKLERDSKIAENESKQQVAFCFLAFLMTAMGEWEAIQKWREFNPDTWEQRFFYAPILFAIRYLRFDSIQAWWQQALEVDVLTMIAVLEDCGHVFLFDPTEEAPSVPVYVKEVEQLSEKEKRRAKKKPAKRDAGVDEAAEKATEIVLTDMLAHASYPDFKGDSLSYHTYLSHLNTEVDQSVLRLMIGLVEDFIGDGHKKGKSVLANRVMLFIHTWMNRPASDPVVATLYALIRFIVIEFRDIMFRSEKDYSSRLSSDVLRDCNSRSFVMRSEAATTIYTLLKHDFIVEGSFNRVRIELLMSLGKLVAEAGFQSDDGIKRSLQSIPSIALLEFSNPNLAIVSSNGDELEEDEHGSVLRSIAAEKMHFCARIEAFSTQLETVMRDTFAVNHMEDSADIDRKAELYLDIADGYKTTPELRIVWLSSLARLQEDEGLFPEAAMCSIQVTAITFDALFQQRKVPHVLKASCFTDRFLGISTMSFVDQESIHSPVFSLANFFEFSRVAIQHCMRAFMFTSAASLLDILLKFYLQDQNYADVAATHTELAHIYERISESGASEEELMGKLFLVEYAGKDAALPSGAFICRETRGDTSAMVLESIQEKYPSLQGVEVSAPGGGYASLTANSSVSISVRAVRSLGQKGPNLFAFAYDVMDGEQATYVELSTASPFPFTIRRLKVEGTTTKKVLALDSFFAQLEEQTALLEVVVEESEPRLMESYLVSQLRSDNHIKIIAHIPDKKNLSQEQAVLLEDYLAAVDECYEEFQEVGSRNGIDHDFTESYQAFKAAMKVFA